MTQTVLLGDIAEVLNGAAFSSRDFIPKSNAESDDLPVFKMGNLSIGGGIRLGKEDYISREKLLKFKKQISRPSDILMCMTDMKSSMNLLGYSGQIRDEEFAINQRVGIIRPNLDMVNPEFLYYYLNSPDFIKQIRSTANSGVQVNLSTSAIRASEVRLPDSEQQERVANIIGSIDGKIKLNRRMNETLERMGQALFHNYFIDNPEADDWDEKSLDEIANFLNGVAMQKFPDDGGPTLPVIKIREMSGGITSNTDIGSANIPEKYIVHDGDILFSWSGTLIVKPWCDGVGALNQHLFKVTSDEYPKWFYYYWTKYHLQSFIETAAGKATTMGHIQRQHLTDAKVKVPSENQLAEITKVMKPILDKQITNELECRMLVNLRDSLLPHLISGKIKV